MRRQLVCVRSKSDASEAAVRLAQKREFFRRGSSTNDDIAMREAAEAIDDRFVLLGVAQTLRVPECGKQLQGSRLREAILAVFERHVEELALAGIERLV